MQSKLFKYIFLTFLSPLGKLPKTYFRGYLQSAGLGSQQQNKSDAKENYGSENN